MLDDEDIDSYEPCPHGQSIDSLFQFGLESNADKTVQQKFDPIDLLLLLIVTSTDAKLEHALL